jgi:hypothetical protein
LATILRRSRANNGQSQLLQLWHVANNARRGGGSTPAAAGATAEYLAAVEQQIIECEEREMQHIDSASLPCYRISVLACCQNEGPPRPWQRVSVATADVAAGFLPARACPARGRLHFEGLAAFLRPRVVATTCCATTCYCTRRWRSCYGAEQWPLDVLCFNETPTTLLAVIQANAAELQPNQPCANKCGHVFCCFLTVQEPGDTFGLCTEHAHCLI